MKTIIKRRDSLKYRKQIKKTSGIGEKKNLDLLLKLPVGLVGLFYVIGIFVHGFYYGAYGINSLNLFKVSYILAGFWAVIYLLFPGLFLFFFISLVCSKEFYFDNQKLNQIPKVKLIKFIAILIFILLAILFLYDPFSFEESKKVVIIGRIKQTDENLVVLQDYLFLSIFFFLSSVIILLAGWFTLNNIKHFIGRHLILLILAGMFVSLILTSIQTFSTELYGKIPVYIGGGKLRTVEIMLKADESEVNQYKLYELNSNNQSPILKQPSETKVETIEEEKKENLEKKEPKEVKEMVFNMPFQLILETNEGYYVLSRRRETVFIPNAKVIYFTYNPQPIIFVRPVR